MNLSDLLIFLLLVLLSSRLFKEILRVAGNYKIGHKHVGVGNPQAHNNRPAACPPLENTLILRVEAPRSQQRAQNVTPLRPEDPQIRNPCVPAEAPAEKPFFKQVDPRRVFKLEAGDPYVPAYKLFFAKVPAGAPAEKPFFRKVAPRRVFETEAGDPYVPAYKLFFAKVPAGAPSEKPFFRKVAPRRVFETEAGDPYVPAYKLFFKKSEH